MEWQKKAQEIAHNYKLDPLPTVSLAFGALAIIVTLAGCEGGLSGSFVTDCGGPDQTQIVAEIYSDPAKVVCDPFQNNPGQLGADRYHGIVGRLGYVPNGGAAAQLFRDFADRGTWVDASLFLTDLNIPTRSFDLGFFNQEGSLLVDQTGDKLYENFALDMESRIQLTASDAEGDYQFAVLSDDGSIMEIDRGNGWEVLVGNDGLTATRLRGSLERIHLTHGDGMPIRVKYFQGPRFHIALAVLWRPYPEAGGFPAQDVRFGQSGNSLFFDYTVTPSIPKAPYFDLLNRGWRPVPGKNFQLPAHVLSNPCTPPAPQYRVAKMCTDGEFTPKTTVKLGLSIDPTDSARTTIINNFATIGFTAIPYTDAEVIAAKPQTDGVTVLAVSRKATVAPITAAYTDAIRAYVAQGGSLIGEYDGAALAFTDRGTGQVIMNNLTSMMGFFTGRIAGGGALLPLESGRAYVIDSTHPIMAGMPVSFINGVRTAFAMTEFDDSWLSVQAQFISSGYADLVPAGTYPSVMSARCGSGRVVLFTMNHFQVMNQTPVNRMVQNSLNWVIGQ